jgi:hypothetical protein
MGALANLQPWKKTEHLRRGVIEASLYLEMVVTRRPGRQAKLLQPKRNESEVGVPHVHNVVLLPALK